MAVDGIFDKVGIDLVVSLPITKEGYNGILVITEYLSKYPYAVPIRSKTAIEIAEKFFIYITLFGPPKHLISDQGKEFVNEVIKNLTEIAGIEHRISSAYHPRTNGNCERFNQTLINALKKHSEDDPQCWNAWIPYVLMAYRTRKHSISGFTPYELVFGRTMNEFEDWSDTCENEIGLWKRSVEIKKLIEENQIKARKNISQAQVSQIKNQNQSHNIVEEKLTKGTYVMIKTANKKNKLEANYHGPFTIDDITKNGNYWLKNSKGERLKQSLPLSRLKVVEKPEDEEIFEVEKILKHRKRNGKFYYWKGFKIQDATWEPETNFNTTECIENYWRDINSIEKTSISVNLLFLQVLLFILFLPVVMMTEIKSSFKLCKSNDHNVIVDMSYMCDLQNNSFNGSVAKKIYHILTKRNHNVNGKGYICKKNRIIRKTYMTLFGERWLDKEVVNEELSKEDSFIMVTTKRCAERKMTCIESSCLYNDEPEIIFKRMRDDKVIYYHCATSSYAIIAASEKNVLFIGKNNPCYVHEYHCIMKDQTIVWGRDVLHTCPFEYVQSSSFMVNNNLIVSNQENLLFQLTAEFRDCDLDIYSTTSGLFVSTNNDSLKLDKSPMEISTLNELILADIDYKTIKTYKALMENQQVFYQKLCNIFFNSIRTMSKNSDQYITLYDISGEELVIHVKNGIPFIPHCNILESITIKNFSTECFEDIPVEIIVDKKRSRVFLQSYGILKQETRKLNDCDKYENTVFLPENKGLLKQIGQEIVLIIPEQIHYQKIHLQTLNWSKLNFMHDQKIIQGTDLLLQFKNLTNVWQLDGEFDSKNLDTINHSSESSVAQVVNSSLSKIKKSWNEFMHQFLLYIIALVVIVIVITLIYFVIKRKKKLKKIPVVTFKHNTKDKNESRVSVRWDSIKSLIQSSRTPTQMEGGTCDVNSLNDSN